MLVKLFEKIQSTCISGTSSPAASPDPLMLADNLNLHNLEKFHSHRYRERMAMSTTDIDAYCGYVNIHSKDADVVPLVSVDEVECSSQSIFNHMDVGRLPGHCDDTASCVLLANPMYAQIIKMAEKTSKLYSQRSVIDWIADWNEWIDDPAKLAGQLQTLKADHVSKRAQSEGDWKREKSAMESVEINAGAGDVPERIIVSFEPYDGFEQRTLEIAVAATVHDDEIQLRLRVLGFEALRKLIAKEFTATLTEKLSAEPFIGTIKPAA